MPRYAVFFEDESFCGSEAVRAMDRDHALAIAALKHPHGRLASIEEELLEGCDRFQLLADWLQAQGQSQSRGLEVV